MSKKTKVWLFYLQGEYDVYGTFPNELYAYTTEMVLAGLFVTQRNMDMFHMKIVKCNKDELNDLYREHMFSILHEYSCYTRGKNNKLSTVDMVITSREQDLISSQSSLYTNEYLMSETMINPIILKNKYIKALELLGYGEIYRYTHDTEAHMNSKLKLYPDVFAVLMDNFGELFLEGGG